jgi:hypothetical protein
MTAYVPIDCGFYDRLEAAAARGAPVDLVLAAADGPRAVTARVLDVWAEGGADWVAVEGVGRVRADAVLALGGVDRPGGLCAVRPGGPPAAGGG